MMRTTERSIMGGWMKRLSLAMLAVAAFATAMQSSTAHASGLRVSFGQQLYLAEPLRNTAPNCSPCYDGNRRRPVDIEVMPYFDFGILTLDLAVLFNIEARNNLGFDMTFRPGVRVFLPLGFYARGSVLISAMNINWGSVYANFNLSVGGGYQLTISNWGIFGEALFNPALRAPWSMPVEFRVGVLHQI